MSKCSIGFCSEPAAEIFMRISCPKCDHFQVYEICVKCEDAIKNDIRKSRAVRCVKCGWVALAKDFWTVYQNQSQEKAHG